MTELNQNTRESTNVDQLSLIFIPDISGFTKFVNETEIDHSQHIIKELLEIIIDANQLDLRISEVEGDAVLFYKLENVPSPEEVVEQAREMFLRFHQHLRLYERDRICECGACSTAHRLTLKVLAHTGELRHMQIKDHSKLLGSDLILAHRLMKNSVPSDEYLLVTENLYEDTDRVSDQKNWVEWKDGRDQYSELGSIDYRFASLTPLHDQVADLPPRETYEKTSDPIQYEFLVNAPLAVVHKVLTDIDLKPLISEGVVNVEYDKNRIPRVGTLHQCVLPSGYLDIRATENQVEGNERLYAERIENFPIFKQANVLYSMKGEGESTKLKIDLHYSKKGFLDKIKSFIMRPILKSQFRKSIDDAKLFAEKVHSGEVKIDV